MIIINEDVELIKENIECNGLRVYHFCEEINNKNKDNYFLNIICCEFKSINDLRNSWNMVVDNVALYIQSNLEKIIELYNIYIIFFEKQIDEQLLYEIEQNKYSSRKIVIKNSMPNTEKELKEIIKRRLFDFYVEKSEDYFDLDKKLKQYNEQLYKYIKDQEINENDLEEIMEISKDDNLRGDTIE